VPRLRDLIPKLVIMGGANRYEDVTQRVEFDVRADPEAARIVLRSGIRKITLVRLDATQQALVSLDECAALRALGTPTGQWRRSSPNAGSGATTGPSR
jgi:inosine-uridine nucleoside N-ribohydrolase